MHGWVFAHRENRQFRKGKENQKCKQFEQLERESCGRYASCPVEGLRRLLSSKAEDTIEFTVTESELLITKRLLEYLLTE